MDAKEIPFSYSEDFLQISLPEFRGWIVHLLCLGGEGSMVYNRKYVKVSANDAVVLSRPDLVSHITCGEGMKVEFVASPSRFLYSLLPVNHYGIGGGISLFDNPVMPLSERDSVIFHNDLAQIRGRMSMTEHKFYNELMGSLARTMIYDLFDFHARLYPTGSTGERTSVLVRGLIGLLEKGTCMKERSVAYYADKLNVSPKYLYETVRRVTGKSMMKLIDQYTVPLVMDLLKNSSLSLSQISEEMNFNSPSYFTRYVKKHLGVSPNEFRRSLIPDNGE